jgi:hypothetical protein
MFDCIQEAVSVNGGKKWLSTCIQRIENKLVSLHLYLLIVQFKQGKKITRKS